MLNLDAFTNKMIFERDLDTGKLRKDNIGVNLHYIPVHILPYYKGIGYGDADLANAEEYYSRCISLPMYPTLTDKEQDFVIEHVLNFVGGNV